MCFAFIRSHNLHMKQYLRSHNLSVVRGLKNSVEFEARVLNFGGVNIDRDRAPEVCCTR